MKSFITPQYTFTPGQSGVGTIDLNGIPNFNIKKLVAIINMTRGVIIYSTADASNRYTNISSTTLTLNVDTSSHNSNDILQVIYDNELDLSVIANNMIPPDLTAICSVGKVGNFPDDSSRSTITGSGELSYNMKSSTIELSVGSLGKEPGRIYCSGRSLMNGDKIQYLNGVNTPWNNWNEFGGISEGLYVSSWWESEFTRLEERGINCCRIWVSCDSDHQGVLLNSDGTTNGPTATFWSNVDDLVTRATAHKIFLMPTLMSFDHFTWNKSSSVRWMKMLAKRSNVESFVQNYVVPFAVRYKDNPYVFCIDLCNEIDWLSEQGDRATQAGSSCTPVGNGSDIVNFDHYVPDYIDGVQLVVNSIDLGNIIERVSNTSVRTTYPYNGASATFTTPNWTYTCWSWNIIRQYLAIAAAGIHENAPNVLVSVGQGTIKYGSDLYDGDKYSDTLLIGLTNNTKSVLDVHLPHWYSWAEPWYRIMLSPIQHGLSAKPAIMSELPMTAHGMNVPCVQTWRRQTYYNPASYPRTGLYVRKDDGSGNLRFYRCTQAGLSGLDNGPIGEGSNLVDGDARWESTSRAYRGQQDYNVYDMVITDVENSGGLGRCFMCTVAGTTGNDGGPYGTETITLGTATFQYIRDAIIDEKVLLDYFIDNGWAGHLPWTSNDVDYNLGLYETGLGQEYPVEWAPNTDYYANTYRTNDGMKFYRCIIQGTSASSGGPTGTGETIVDGTVTWKYVKQLDTIPWTPAGIAMKDFANENDSVIYPILPVAWNNSGSSVFQSAERVWYQHGDTLRYVMSFSNGTDVLGATKRVGPFDDTDGVFIEMDTSGVKFVIRSYGIDNTINRNDWNQDKFDGSGSSSITLDFADSNIHTLVIELDKFNGIKFGFAIGNKVMWAHHLRPTMSTDVPMPHLPLRWEVRSAQALPAIAKLNAGVATAYSRVSKVQESSISFSVNSISTPIGGANTNEIIALRIVPSKLRFGTMCLKKLGIQTTSTEVNVRLEWLIEIDPTASSSGTWNLVPGSSLVEYNTTRNISANGKRIAGGFGVNTLNEVFTNLPKLLINSSGSGEVLSIRLRNVENAEHYFWKSVSWDEGLIR